MLPQVSQWDVTNTTNTFCCEALGCAISETFYTDMTRAFSAVLLKNMHYYISAYDCDTNAIIPKAFRHFRPWRCHLSYKIWHHHNFWVSLALGRNWGFLGSLWPFLDWRFTICRFCRLILLRHVYQIQPILQRWPNFGPLTFSGSTKLGLPSKLCW